MRGSNDDNLWAPVLQWVSTIDAGLGLELTGIRRCITDAVIRDSRCPVCKNAVLLYCLFRIDTTVTHHDSE